MRSYQEIIRAISVRWIIKQTLRAVIYCVNPINFLKLMLRLFKWLLYIALGAVALGMLSLSIGNYAHAAEWTPAKKTTVQSGTCQKLNNGSPVATVPNTTLETCLTQGKVWDSSAAQYPTRWNPLGSTAYDLQVTVNGSWYGTNVRFVITGSSDKYVCPPDGKPEFIMGPIVNANGTVCEKKPVQCLLGSVKDTNVITGKEFCRPICKGIAGNTYGDTTNPVKYFTSMFGSVQIQCYGQCSIETVGGAVNLGSNPNVWQGVIKFTGENCPVQTQGTEEETSTAGANTPVTPPSSSAATDAAQNQLQNAASSAISSQVSGAQGTADLNQVVNKLAEVHNASEKTKAEQNAAIGKIIQNTGKDIQASIKEAQLAASQGGAGASMGQIQTANAIKDGNAALGTKLDGIKDAIDKGNEDNGQSLPPGDSNIDTDPKDIYPHPNDWGTRNYSTVMQQHVAAMNALPLFSGLAGFFQVDFAGGTCPTFTIDAPDLGGGSAGTLVFDMLCNTDFERLFVIIALCVKLLGLYAAFRIALLD
ncbi:hypothetical protein H2137_00790 [Aeromonas hydrophila]|uniref:hypothetical protein n=1 Tax=Aeromonas hydrophila TaxID=644 RepID=UPI001655ECD8|nr:hypothetical protein [Aeromonas hydrophila]MBC8670705.1 hypothetical protein [Aeromonas hydrophila]MBC8686643.1 hypothetical protein [Aeromonas hydrophila]